MGGLTGGKSDSSGSAQQSANSFVFPEQIAGLMQLYGGAQSLQQQQQGQIGPVAQRSSDRLGARGFGFLNQLSDSGRGGAQATQAADELLKNPLDISQGGFMENLARLAAPNSDPFLQQQVDFLGEDIAQQVQRLMPGVDQEFIEGGTAGGSRNSIGQGILAEAGVNQFARGATQLRSDARDLSLNASQAGVGAVLDAGQVDTDRLRTAGGLGLQSQGANIQAASVGLQSLADLYNIQTAPFGSQFSPLLNLAKALGNPAILSQSQGTSQRDSSSVNFGMNLV